MGVVMLMGLNSSVIKATVSGDLVPDSAAVQVQLGISRKVFCADGAYVVNSEGVVVAHATVGNSSTGVKLGFRPSFKNALGGTPNFYAAVGTVTNDRGLYYAAPVWEDATQTSPLIGVVMLKLPPTRVDQLLRFAGATTLLLSPQGVSFASARDEWFVEHEPASQPCAAGRHSQAQAVWQPV